MSDVQRKQNRRILSRANNERSYQGGGAVYMNPSQQEVPGTRKTMTAEEMRKRIDSLLERVPRDDSSFRWIKPVPMPEYKPPWGDSNYDPGFAIPDSMQPWGGKNYDPGFSIPFDSTQPQFRMRPKLPAEFNKPRPKTGPGQYPDPPPAPDSPLGKIPRFQEGTKVPAEDASTWQAISDYLIEPGSIMGNWMGKPYDAEAAQAERQAAIEAYENASWHERMMMGDPRVMGGTAPIVGGAAKLPKLLDVLFAAKGGYRMWEWANKLNQYVKPNWRISSQPKQLPAPGVNVPATTPGTGVQMASPRGPNWQWGQRVPPQGSGVPATTPGAGVGQFGSGPNWQWWQKPPMGPINPGNIPPPNVTWNTYMPQKTVMPWVTADERYGGLSPTEFTRMPRQQGPTDISQEGDPSLVMEERQTKPVYIPFEIAHEESRNINVLHGRDPWDGSFIWTDPETGLTASYTSATQAEMKMREGQANYKPLPTMESKDMPIADQSVPKIEDRPFEEMDEVDFLMTKSKGGRRQHLRNERKEIRKGSRILYGRGTQKRRDTKQEWRKERKGVRRKVKARAKVQGWKDKANAKIDRTDA